MIVCDKVCLSVVWTSSLLSCERSQSSLVGETPRQGIDDSGVYFGESVFRQLPVVHGKPLPAFAIFLCLQAQNNLYTNAAYLGWHVLNSFKTNTIVFLLFSMCIEWKVLIIQSHF